MSHLLAFLLGVAFALCIVRLIEVACERDA